jgi:3,4-dihydroxy 2-butanone 4-phosphate synthase/GTP cyclohydrolase II
MARIAKEDAGVIIVIGGSGDQNSTSLEARLEAIYDRERVKSTQPGSEHIQVQQVGVGSQILRDLGVSKMRLMGAPLKYAGLSGFDLEVVENLLP